jgi:hypothetical protein
MAALEREAQRLLNGNPQFASSREGEQLAATLGGISSEFQIVQARLSQRATAAPPGETGNQDRALAEDLVRAFDQQLEAARSQPPSAEAQAGAAWLKDQLAAKPSHGGDTPAFAGAPVSPPVDHAGHRQALTMRLNAVRNADPSLSGGRAERLLDDAGDRIIFNKEPKKTKQMLLAADDSISLLEARAAAKDAKPESLLARCADVWQRLNLLANSRQVLTRPETREKLNGLSAGLAKLWREKTVSGLALEKALREVEAQVVHYELESAQVTGPDDIAAEVRLALSQVNALLGDSFIQSTPAAGYLGKLRDALMTIWRQRNDPTLPEATRLAAVEEINQRLEAESKRLRRAGEAGADTDYTRFVNWAMHPDPDQRPTAEQALNHEFLTKPLLTDSEARAVLRMVLQAQGRPG